MKATIDKAGRLVVPKTIRDAAHLAPGTEVEVCVVEGRVEIEPAPLDIDLERRGNLVVGVPRRSAATLTELGRWEIREIRDTPRIAAEAPAPLGSSPRADT